MAEKTQGERRVGPLNILAFGLGDIYGGGAFFIISVFTMYYLITVVGLAPWLAGLVIGLTKALDAIADPVMGYISDRTRTRRLGRRRVWLVAGILPVAASFALLWLPVSFGSAGAAFAYYLFAYIFFYMVFTMVMVPYSSLPADMTTDFKIRNSMSGTRIVFSQISTLIAGVAANPIVNLFTSPAQGHFAMGCAFALLFAAPWVFVVLGTWEMPNAEGSSELGLKLFANFASVFRNRAFRVQIAMYIFAYAAMDVVMAWLKFIMTDNLRLGPGLSTICLGAVLLAQIAALPVYVALSNRRSSRLAYTVGLAVWGCGMLLMFLQSAGGPAWAMVANCVLIGLGLSAGVLVPYQLLPFVADIDELITAKKRAGTYSGSMTLIRKLIQGALVLPLLGLILSSIGYVTAEIGKRQADIAQAPGTLATMRLLFIIIPVILIAGGILAARFMNIDRASHAVLRAEMERLAAGGDRGEVTPETRAVCERLSGLPYEKLYGRG